MRALQDVSLAFRTGSSPPSWAFGVGEEHALAHPRRPGQAYVGARDRRGTELSGLSDKKLTLLRRERMGFVFQFFNLIPTLSAEENVLLPVLIAGKRPGNYGRGSTSSWTS